jgi:hypothetical protein
MAYTEGCSVETLIHQEGQHGQMLLLVDGHCKELLLKVLLLAQSIKAGEEGHAIKCCLTTPMHADRPKIICWAFKVICGG